MIKLKKIWLIVLVIFSFLLFINIIEPSIISKFIFTTKAVSSTFSVSLTINSGKAPNITIYEPKSRFYVNSKNMMLGYSVVDDGAVGSIWFNVNNGSNITLNVNQNIFYFNASLGNNTLYIFANDTQGNLNNTVFVNFSISRYEGFGYEINDSGGFVFNDDTVKEYFNSITGLNSSWTLNVTMHGNNTPSGWISPNIVDNEILYFEMSANAFGDTSGSYNFYFNLSRAVLGEIDPDKIRAYFYNNHNWNELTTTIESSNSNAVEFKAILTHLSQFMIGEKVGGSSTSAGVTGELEKGIKGYIPEKPEEDMPEKPEVIKEPKKKIEQEIEKSISPLLVPKFEPIWKISMIETISILSLLIIFIFMLKGSLFRGDRYMKKIFVKRNKMIIVIVLLFVIIYYFVKLAPSVTGSVILNVKNSENNILLLITLFMVVIALIYFFTRRRD